MLSPLRSDCPLPMSVGLVEIGGMASFQHAFNLHETVWRSVLPIGQSIGEYARKLES